MMKKFFGRGITLAVLAAVVIAVCGGLYSKSVFNDISNSVVRLHVIANSDSEADQALKLKVRDATIECTKELVAECKSADEALVVMKENSQTIKQAAQDCIINEGNDYIARVYVGEYYFPAKSYGQYSFPSGEYQALRVVIGEGEGKNWWCVLFPPLCYVNSGTVSVQSDSDDILQEYLSDEAYSVVDGGNDCNKVDDSSEIDECSGVDSSNVTVKFKIVELFQNTMMNIKNILIK